MTHNVYHFLEQQRTEAPKKALSLRKTQFTEIYEILPDSQAQTQAARCISCGNPYCQWKCPLHNFIPDWLKLAQEGRIIEAVELAHQTNSLPEICGRVCPQDRLCEGACTLHEEFGAVAIGNIERYLTDTALFMGWKPDLSHVRPSGKRVAIIGAGPAGLACADILARHGVQAVVFDRHPEIGGLLTFGIPSFKLEKQLMRQRQQLFSEMGIEFRLNSEIGTQLPLQQLVSEFDALFLAVGAYHSLSGNLPNEQADGVYNALPFLIANTRHLLGYPPDNTEPYINLAGKQVVVLGGGDTAMDCVRSAIRQNATRVICAYRRDEASMPGSRREVRNAREEGGEFLFNLQPLRIETDNEGRVTGITLVTTRMGKADASGRRQAEPLPGSEQTLAAEAILLAFGFRPHSMPWLDGLDVELDALGRIKVSRSPENCGQTSHPKIFAGGDVVLGSDLVVTAIAQGRQSAAGIVNYLSK